jgi:hypothetical protein
VRPRGVVGPGAYGDEKAGGGSRCLLQPRAAYHGGMTEASDVKDVSLPDAAQQDAEAEAARSAVEVAETWLAELADRIAVPASDVQDHLLDLWGLLDEGPARAEVERWLTETLKRNLYSVSDINDRLEILLPAS